MRIRNLLAAGVKAARQARGWTQEDAARHFRLHGLTTWRTGTVGGMEAGLRNPRLDDVILICASLGVTLEELLPGTGEAVELGDGMVMTPATIRALLAGAAPGAANSHPAQIQGSAPGDLPGDAERHAAKRLGAEVAQVVLASRALWGRSFTEERDRRAGLTDGMTPRTVQARRGLAARAMLAELQAAIGAPVRG